MEDRTENVPVIGSSVKVAPSAILWNNIRFFDVRGQVTRWQID